VNVLIVSGCPTSKCQDVFGLLSASGVAHAKPAERSASVSIGAWHDRALPTPDHPARQPGRALEQVAGDIFIANWDQPVWGWSDHRSTWLLEYWRAFDNAVQFVLVCTPPEIALGRAIVNVAQPAESPEATVSRWLAYHTEMTRFYHRSRDRCLLVSETEVSAEPKAFIAACGQTFDIPLNVAAASLPSQPDDALGVMLARQYLESVPQVGELWREIQASRTALGTDQDQPPAPPVSTNQIIVETGRLIRTSAANLAFVTTAKTQAEQSKIQTEQAKKQAEERIGQLEQNLSAATGECEQQKKKTEDALLEGELLLLQLHQTQEELESYYLQNQDLESSFQKSKKEFSELQTERNEFEKRAQHFCQETERLTGALHMQEEIAKQGQSELATLTKERDEERLKAAILRKDSDTLRNTLIQREQALEKSETDLRTATRNVTDQSNLAAKFRQEAEELRSNLSQQKQTLQRHQDALQEAEQTVEIAVRQRDEEKGQAEKLQRDRELILARLDQVQEELERQFNQNRQLRKANADYDRRWEKLNRRYPDYLDLESIEILESTRTESAAVIQWRINGVFIGKRLIPQFDLATLLVGGSIAMLLQRQPEQGANGPLLSWPLEAAEQNHIILQPKGPEEDLRQRLSILQGLSTTDWRLVNALCPTLAGFLRAKLASLPPELGAEKWIEQFTALRDQFRSIPVGWRYDGVILRRQALHPDYEHLWFRLENVQFGDRHWPRFEFRLAASLIQPGGFSEYPKLEFPAPDEGPAQFDNWFAETDDELGPRYELRFALADQAMDMAVFNRLSTTDQLQLISILVNLPAMLTKLENSGVKLARPWADWQQIVVGMIDVLRHNLALSHAAPPPVTEIEATEGAEPEPRAAARGRTRKQTGRRR